MEYKRLKEKLETILTLPELPFEEDLTAVDCKQMYDILCKIEQGTLIELPCKVGDTVWEVSPFSKFPTAITAPNIHTILRWKEDEVFGRELFLTREEAEKRLKELQNG